MWSNAKDINELGEHILLLQPITGKKNKKTTPSSPSSSHIGGLPSFYPNDASITQRQKSTVCSSCKKQMHLLLQINAPLDDLDRSLYVFGCNRPKCHVSPGDNKFTVNYNDASLLCYRSQQSKEVSVIKSPVKAVEPVSKKFEENDWGDDNDDDDWGASYHSSQDKTNELSMDDLEAMISKCEMQSKAATNGAQFKSISDKPLTDASSSVNKLDEDAPSFKRFNLEMFDEPFDSRTDHSQHNSIDDDEDYDDFTSCLSTVDPSKVNQMLSKYLDVEDDLEILSVLKGGGLGSNSDTSSIGGSGGRGERYERLPPEERAFLTFTKRLRRAPLQVVRYAYGGVPLWSIPHQLTKCGPNKNNNDTRTKKSNNPNQKQNPSSFTQIVPDVPPCKCGSKRVFEFQLLPSMLHVLEVDSGTVKVDESMDVTSIGGMNWGSIAVYSCPDSCDECREEVCIVQRGDEVEMKKIEGYSAGKDLNEDSSDADDTMDD